MGRGDSRTRKGKIFKSSFGVTRKARTEKAEAAPVAVKEKKAPAKKAAAKKKSE